MISFYDKLYDWSKKTPHKVVLRWNKKIYTFEEIIKRIHAISYDEHEVIQVALGKRYISLIQSCDLIDDLCLWFRAQYEGHIPILVHKEMDMGQLVETLEDMSNTWEREGDALATIGFGVLSSGTTGSPKIFFRTYESWTDCFEEQKHKFSLTVDTVLLCHGSMSFTGNLNSFLSVIWFGGTVESMSSFVRGPLCEMLDSHRITHIYLLPTKLRLLERLWKNISLSVKVIFTGSQMIDKELVYALHERFPSSEVILYYGASELNYIASCTSNEWLSYEGTVGKVWDHVQVHVVDGFYEVSTPYGIYGISMPFRIGDRGTINEEGFLMFEGREGDVVNKGGYKLYIPRIEQQVRYIDGISDVVAVGVNDPVRGQELGLIVTLDKDVAFSSVLSSIRRTFKGVESPKIVLEVEEIPLKDSSKVDLKKVRNLLEMAMKE